MNVREKINCACYLNLVCTFYPTKW